MKKLVCILFLIYVTMGLSAQWQPAGDRIKTPWGESLDPEKVLQEYPRPIMEREKWLNLNGLWDYSLLPQNAQIPTKYQGKILVPFAIESSLSGVQKPVAPNQEIVYKRTFVLPNEWKGQNILLHFGAVDWKTEVYLNGKTVGTHTGGYTPFSFDITPYLKTGEQELIVKVWDPTNEGYQARGKQDRNPQLLFYTAVSGIWQTVWLEPVHNKHITAVHTVADIDKNQLRMNVSTQNTNPADQLKITVKEEGTIVAQGEYSIGENILLHIPAICLWSPEQPFLYDIEIRLYDNHTVVDEVKSYAAMRKISIANDKTGQMRIRLNNADYVSCGVMDQGYWPDGLYTAPSDEALLFDIQKAKELGFNLIRKHQKTEPARWYTHCDRLGMLVWQDMPSGDFSFFRPAYGQPGRSFESETQFRQEWKEIMDYLKPYPSVVVWIVFNEGWGQFKTEELAQWTKYYDPSRLVDPAGGKTHVNEGDLLDYHHYPFPQKISTDRQRAIVLGEYGGISCLIPDHLWQTNKLFGHANTDNPKMLISAYTMSAMVIQDLITNGLSAFSYTQLTDIESEVNGLITYDRKVVKVDERIFKALNEDLRNTLQQKNNYKIVQL